MVVGKHFAVETNEPTDRPTDRPTNLDLSIGYVEGAWWDVYHLQGDIKRGSVIFYITVVSHFFT